MMLGKYGNRDDFLVRFNPDYQRKICHDTDLCLFGDYPTLITIRIAYGNNAPVMWLMPQLYELSEFCGVKKKLEGRPLEECASVIAGEYGYLKVSELMLFFQRFKSGRYGKMYGEVDPLVITTSLRVFIGERAQMIDAHDQKLRNMEDERSRKNAISWEEYCKRNGINKPNPLSR